MTQIFYTIKLLLKVLLGRSFYVEPDCEFDCEEFGDGYGAWKVVTSALTADSVIYSAGVGEDIGFDCGLIERFGMTIHAFDPTPRSIQWLKQQDLPSEFCMHEYGIADYDGVAYFEPPKNPEHVSHSIVTGTSAFVGLENFPVRRLKTIMALLGHHQIDVLKLDIEGAEYSVIDDMLAYKIYPAQVLVELHHRFPSINVSQSKALIDKLRQVGYRLFFVSKSKEEFCFILDEQYATN